MNKLTMAAIFATIFACLAIASPAEIVITVTEDDGTVSTEKISGPGASAGIASVKAWMATQVTCEDRQRVNCTPKYKNLADVIKQGAIDSAERISVKFPSPETKAVADDIANKEAQLKAARKKLIDSVRK